MSCIAHILSELGLAKQIREGPYNSIRLGEVVHCWQLKHIYDILILLILIVLTQNVLRSKSTIIHSVKEEQPENQREQMLHDVFTLQIILR